MPDTDARPFTGTHLALIVTGFFAVVIAVNMTMATLASRTFSGVIVKNGYVASQDFDRWLAAGRAQAALGWSVDARIDGDRLVVEARDRGGAPLVATAVATLSHPVDARRAHRLMLRPAGTGALAARHGLAAGQWEAVIRLDAQGHVYWRRQRLIVGGRP